MTGDYDPSSLPPALRLLTVIFGSGLGTGYVPKAHGTAASALTVLLWVLFVPRSRRAECAVATALHAASVPLSAWGERMWGPDPGRVTIDEFAGQAIALTALPNRRWPWLLAAFLLFRVFDIFKLPFTRRRIEPIPHGIGTTLDDSIAGVFAWLLLRAAVWFRK